ncbi:hypothetical protein [Chryseobacterium sp. BIGb0232]|uniref:hypothetical protein n=1 Tax=Chryseobacterium sp. BIGb0232 TaxID=2940598 RepID=UPI000F498AE3|nr:hypothetical protein [Chryseobacterium sp. BIGb0232]MCS4303751.1 hypothetical protein [Chryseobacterium sp. BIGb0232]ROS10449.1 hypothetical protein EDF65_4331 [Chryseobacterium nakagawai]
MKNQIKIHNPCPENWDNMQDLSSGKFCEKCSKCIIDFTNKTDEQIQDILTAASGREICGRTSTRSLALAAAGIILVTNLSFAQVQSKNNFRDTTEQQTTDITKVSGRLIFKETQKAIPNAEIFFITQNIFLKSTTNENGYFQLDVPNNLIEEENVLYFNFDKLNEKRKEKNIKDTISDINYGDQTIVFSRKEKVENKKFQIDYKGFEIGAVVVVENPPPNYYYFDGKKISKEKFEKLKKENPQYQYFSFEGKEADIISQDNFIDTLYLLYSN